MKKLLLILAVASLLVCAFALTVSAAPQNYQSYEAVLVSGEKITVYQAKDWDQWQGRIWITDTMYTEAPVDSEGTYQTVDWAQIKVLDFTNAWGHIYNATTGEHELKRGTNGSMHICKTSFTAANATSLETVITGAAKIIVGPSFSGLPALVEVVVDNTLEEIGYNAFDGCKKLTTITIKEGTKFKTIGQQAFIRCSALETVDFLDTVTSMGTYAFSGCTSLKTVEWPTGMVKIPDGTFDGCTLLEFEIPDWITSIGGAAFRNCDSLVSVTIPDGVTNLGGAFGYCDNLEEIIITENSQISNKLIALAEYSPKLKSIRIPPLVTELGYDNFRGCTSLSEIIWPNNLLKISGGQNFSNIAMKKITIPNTVIYIGDGNFSGLEEINFGASMTNLSGGALSSKNIKRVYFPGTITQITSNLLGYSNPADSSMNITFICTGTYEEALAIMEVARASAAGTGREPNMCKLYDAVLVHASEYDITQEPSGFTFVYGYNACEAYYGGVHAEGAVLNSCQFGCGRNCGQVELLENPQHQLVLTKVFGENGYFSACSVTQQCSVCATKTMEEALDSLFVSKGISAKTFGGDIGIVQGYELNKASIEMYKTYAPDFDFGVLAYANASGAAVSPKPGDDKVIDISFDNMANDYLEVKLTGIPAERRDVAIIFCIYVTEGDKVYYLDDGVTAEKTVGKSYNEIVG